MQKKSVKFDKVHIKNKSEMLSGTRWTHFITVRSPITEASLSAEHGVGPEPHHPLMVVMEAWLAWVSVLIHSNKDHN